MEEKRICKMKKGDTRPTGRPTPATSHPPGHCPKGWLESSRKCFLVVFLDKVNGLRYYEARRSCRSLNLMSDLATIESAEETSLIVSRAVAVGDTDGLWFGLFRRNYLSDWLWYDNSPINLDRYSNWNRKPEKQTRAYISLFDNYFARVGQWVGHSYGRMGYVCSMKKSDIELMSTTPQKKTVCQRGEFLGDGCYTIQNEKKTWNEALTSCKNYNMNLASIHTVSLTERLKVYIRNTEKYYWIGLNKFNYTEPFLWSDNSVYIYRNWHRVSRDNRYNNCVAISPNAKWRAFNCSTQLESICKKSFGVLPTVPPQIDGTCPDPNQPYWLKYGKYCYLFPYNEVSSYEEALETCSRISSGLAVPVTIHDMSEQFLITRRIQHLEKVWIGLTRESSNQPYRWVDNTSVTFEFWRKYDVGRGDCVALTNDKNVRMPGRWIKQPCSLPDNKKIGFACKTLTIPYPTTPIPGRGKCPPKFSNEDNWEIFGEKCLLFVKSHFADYKLATRICRRVNGTLAEIKTYDENCFIEQQAKKHLPFYIKGLWIGLRRRKNGQYLWETGDKFHFDYFYYKDDRKGNCTVLNTTVHGYWKSHRCSKNHFPFVCQTDLLKDSPKLPTTTKKPTSSKVGLIIGITIGICSLIAIFGGLIYKWKTSARVQTNTNPGGDNNSFPKKIQMSKCQNEESC
ncbi:DgyrCDS14657 [Dimorphilus gyrociliatus]|uniref:DgyrCDS14657 n=1 Tax=Dimorphilus gyrociliatus TaxID=2664684 RepID=A0A7I8WEE6_9ANNE|nr:DgyrCDS14657 [Dimorphilus gyrociliatus]